MNYCRFIFKLIIVILVISFNHSIYAKTPVLTDSRIKTFVYSANDVFPLTLHYGYQSSIELAANEEVEAISIGDTYALQVLPVKKRLFLKSLQENSHTNMTIITTKRTYQFDVTIKNPADVEDIDDDLVYVVRFYYPHENSASNIKLAKAASNEENFKAEKEVLSLKTKYNFNYMYQGSNGIAPEKIFDDGNVIYMKFPKNIGVPSIYILNEEGQEVPVKLYKKGNFIILPKIITQFNIKKDNNIVAVYNQNYNHIIK